MGDGRQVDDALHAAHLLAQGVIIVDVALDVLGAVKKALAQALVIEVLIRAPADDAQIVSIFHQPRDGRATYVSGTACQ